MGKIPSDADMQRLQRGLLQIAVSAGMPKERQSEWCNILQGSSEWLGIMRKQIQENDNHG